MSGSVRSRIDAADYLRFCTVEELADQAASYWRSIAEAASRGEKLTCEVHCRQISRVTRECFALVKALGSADEAEAA
jgi:hypothetical protein